VLSLIDRDPIPPPVKRLLVETVDEVKILPLLPSSAVNGGDRQHIYVYPRTGDKSTGNTDLSPNAIYYGICTRIIRYGGTRVGPVNRVIRTKRRA